MDIVIETLKKEVEPIYLHSPFYTLTIYNHVSRVAQYAKNFAEKLKANIFIAEAGGWTHDLGAAKFGKDNHHITGIEIAAPILIRCGCPLESIGPILNTIYCHRGSQEIPCQLLEAKCVAAGDALDHFTNLEELWRVQVEDLKIMEMKVYQELSEKLARDWKKISPEIKDLLDGTYVRAQEELLKIASKKR